MEPLYETEIVCTYDEYKKYNNTLKVRTKLFYIIILFMWVSAIFLGIRNFETIFAKVVIPSLAVLAYIVLLILMIWFGGKSEWKSNKIMHNKTVVYHFFEDNMEISTENGKVKINYDDLHKIIETKTNFYLMDSLNAGKLILKDNCSPELRAFIQQLMIKVNVKKG